MKYKKNVWNPEITEVVLNHCNVVNNWYQQYSNIFTLVPKKSSGQLINAFPKNLIFSRIYSA